MMKNNLILAPCLFLSLFCSSQSKTGTIEFNQLTENLYIYTTYKELNGYEFPSNSMYLVAPEGIVLIDTPWDTTQFEPFIKTLKERHKKEILFCIATHFHDDRTAGLDYFKSLGIKTFSSKQTYDLCALHNDKQAEYYFTDDTTFSVGNNKIETYYPGPGHTEDNIVIWFDNEKVLYGGCFIKSTENKSLGNIADANLNEWSASVKNAMNKFPRPKFVIPGHFGWKKNKGLKHTLKLLRRHS